MTRRAERRRGEKNCYAIRTLDECARILYEERDPETGERLIPSPLKQNALNLERSAFRKIRAACRELAEYLDLDRSDAREEQRGRFLAARGA